MKKNTTLSFLFYLISLFSLINSFVLDIKCRLEEAETKSNKKQQGRFIKPAELHMSTFYSETLNITKNDIAFYQHSPNTKYLIVKNNIFHKNSSSNNNTYWRCRYFRRMHCHARAVSKPNAVIMTCPIHNHPPMYQEREIVMQKALKKEESKMNGDSGSGHEVTVKSIGEKNVGGNDGNNKFNNRRRR